MQHHPYPSYRQTDLPWLGQIPAHWEVKRLKHISVCLDGKRIPLNSEQRGEMQGEYPYWGANSIVDYVDKWLFDEILVLLGEDGAPFFDKTKDVAFYISGKVWVNNHAHVLRPKNIDSKFLVYVLNTVDYQNFIDGSTRDKLTQGKMNDISIQYPSLPEQQAISAYLDHQTAKIDVLIAKKERLLDLLAEQRAALISQAVTKGLNPDAKMKDSGVAWLGQVPSHWEVKRMKYLSAINPSRSETNHIPEDTEVTFLPMELVGNGSINTEKTKKISDVKQGFTYMTDGDIIVAKITPSFENGKGAIVDGLTNGIGFGTTELHVIRPKHSMVTKYLYYLTTSYLFRNIGAGMMEGTAGQKRVPDDFILNFKAPVPTIDEQEKIVKYLDNQTKRLTDLATKVEIAIERLREYRAALISSAVTGKIKV